MLFELPDLWIVILNVLGIPAIHLGISWLYTQFPRTLFNSDSALYRMRNWENGGKIYQTIFKVRKWKGLLPDAAPWFDGFAKKNLRSKNVEFLHAFKAETCRGEAAHYAQVFGILGTLAWNPGIAAVVIGVYSILSNLPCIILQRHTRARLDHLLEIQTPNHNHVERHFQ